MKKPSPGTRKLKSLLLIALGLCGCGDDDKENPAASPNASQQVSCQQQIAASLIDIQVELAGRSVGWLHPGADAVDMPKIGWQTIFGQAGQVLVYNVQGQAWLYDAPDHWWTDLSEHTASRNDAALVRLPDGQILITGGYDGTQTVDSAELFDPATQTFSPLPPMHQARTQHTATLLDNGLVLIAGWASTAELFDPAALTFTPTGDMVKDGDARAAALLPDGQVLLVGTWEQPFAQIYDPTTGLFSQTGDMHSDHSVFPTATALADGRVLVAGGTADGRSTRATDLYDPFSGTFSPGPPMHHSRDGHGARLLPDGTVLIGGGLSDEGDFLDSAEIFDPQTDGFTLLDSGVDECRYQFSVFAFLP